MIGYPNLRTGTPHVPVHASAALPHRPSRVGALERDAAA